MKTLFANSEQGAACTDTHLSLLQRNVSLVLVVTTLVVIATASSLSLTLSLGSSMPICAVSTWFGIVFLLWRGLAFHPHTEFGSANVVTTIRAAGTAILAGMVPVAHSLSTVNTLLLNGVLWAMTALVILLLILDGVDGYLARHSGLASKFGARFDMEIDALLALVIALFLWQSGKAGSWVLGLGVMRYGFVLASVWSAPLKAQLFPSLRRKIVCVIQLAALCAMLSPFLSAYYSVWIGSFALVCLIASFGRDIYWLYARDSE